MQHPLRSTVEDHLYSFRRYSRARGLLRQRARRAGAGHGCAGSASTRSSSTRASCRRCAGARRWTRRCGARALELADVPGIRAVMPQDEFLRSGALSDFIRDARVDVVFSVSPASEWPKIYAGVDRERVRFEPTLTGYLDERTLTRIDEILRETPERPTDVFYRAGAERPYLGRHGMLKTGIATAGEARGAGARPDDRRLARPGRHAARRRLVPGAGRVALDARSRGRRQHPRPERVRSAPRRCATSPSTPMPPTTRSRPRASPGATASWRCSRSRLATSRRAPRGPGRSSSRAATAACSSPGRHYLPRARRPVRPRRRARAGQGRDAPARS